ncbi:hypothetical protein DFH27DRAFT_476827 [Peziza echinospora]|nr:hypothetical protein DFH27DRAFT_476827 [Peziza echinospora]
MSDNACCSTLPPVITEGYNPKGRYSEINGVKSYITGAPTAKSGVLSIFDIFGFYPQTLQGADILAQHLNAVVVLPDFFDGKPLSLSQFPPDTPEKKAAVGAFFENQADQGKAVARVKSVLKSLKSEESEWKGVEKWAVIGYCWGGKISTLVSGEGSEFVASVQVHPAFVTAENAQALTIPHFLYASGEEPAEAIEAFKTALASHPNDAVREKSEVEVRSDMFHGWMGARARLGEEKYLLGYKEGYVRVCKFLKKFL